MAKLTDHAIFLVSERSAWGGSWGGSGDADQLIQVDLNLDHRNKFCIRKYAEQNETTRRVYATRTNVQNAAFDPFRNSRLRLDERTKLPPEIAKQCERLLFALFTKPT